MISKEGLIMYKSIKLEVIGSAAVITLNRPDKLNALIYPMLVEFKHALAQAEKNKDVTAIVLTGAGRGFCAGMDMNALNTHRLKISSTPTNGPGSSLPGRPPSSPPDLRCS